MKILLAVDGSVHSKKATTALIKNTALYKRTRGSFTRCLLSRSQGEFRPTRKPQQVVSYYQEQGERALAESKRLLDKAGIQYQAKVLAGPISQTIIKQCRVKRCDLIFMGTRGMGSLGGMLLGSTATKVVHLAAMPVVPVK